MGFYQCKPEDQQHVFFTKDLRCFGAVLLCTLSLAFTLGCAKKNSDLGRSPPNSEDAIGPRSAPCDVSGPMKIPTGLDSPTGRTELHRTPARKDKFCAVLLSIDPTFLGWLKSGDKSFEYRKAFPADSVSHILFFDSRAESIVAVADVQEVLAGDPLEISNRTWTRSGTTVDALMSYFGDRDFGFAIELKNFRFLNAPITFAVARAIDPKFQRPYGYLFSERHPKIDAALEAQVKNPEKFGY